MVASAAEAVGRIRPGQRVFLGTGCGQPQTLVRALLDHADEMEDVEIVLLVALGEPARLHRELAQRFRLKPFFIADWRSDAEMRRPSGRLHADLLLGYPRVVSFRTVAHRCRPDPGDGAERTRPLLAGRLRGRDQKCRRECGPGDCPDEPADALDHGRRPGVRLDDLDILVPGDEPLLETALPDPGETSRKIAEYVAALIPDSSTVQLGRAPDCTGAAGVSQGQTRPRHSCRGGQRRDRRALARPARSPGRTRATTGARSFAACAWGRKGSLTMCGTIRRFVSARPST